MKVIKVNQILFVLPIEGSLIRVCPTLSITGSVWVTTIHKIYAFCVEKLLIRDYGEAQRDKETYAQFCVERNLSGTQYKQF